MIMLHLDNIFDSNWTSLICLVANKVKEHDMYSDIAETVIKLNAKSDNNMWL